MSTIHIANVKTLVRQPGVTYLYVGRGPAPAGMEATGLGNPFRVGPQYAQGEAAAAYLPWLRAEYRRAALLGLAGRASHQ